MTTKYDHAAVLAWYAGKAHMRAGAALQVLTRALERGYWEKGEARSTRAALKNATVAQKLAPAVQRLNFFTLQHKVYMALRYGDVYLQRIAAEVHTYQFLPCFNALIRYVDALLPVYSAMDQLDATIPAPVLTSLGVSPTITQTLVEAGLNSASVRVCPIRWEQRNVQHPKEPGKIINVTIGVLLWPDNTLHNYTRFARAKSGHNKQCHACAHAIRNPFNWVPLLIDSAEDGTPHSMWVGKDCAQKLFGIQVKGELRLTTEQA